MLRDNSIVLSVNMSYKAFVASKVANKKQNASKMKRGNVVFQQISIKLSQKLHKSMPIVMEIEIIVTTGLSTGYLWFPTEEHRDFYRSYKEPLDWTFTKLRTIFEFKTSDVSRALSSILILGREGGSRDKKGT